MADLEKLHLKLGLSGTYWDKRPSFRISFNDQVLKEDKISKNSGEVEYHEFDVQYDSDAKISICLLNKEDSDTIQNDDKTAILKDMLLNIVSVEIEDIQLGMVAFQNGVYATETTVTWENVPTNIVHNCMNLGWNGTWTLSWTNPFYIWLLETM